MYNQPIYLDKGYRKLLYKTGNIFFVPPKKFYKTRDIVLFFCDNPYFLEKPRHCYIRLGIYFIFSKILRTQFFIIDWG